LRSQSDLAKQISVSREIVERYERGDAVPSIEIVRRMADAFEVSLDYLVGAAEKQINKEMLHQTDLHYATLQSAGNKTVRRNRANSILSNIKIAFQEILSWLFVKELSNTPTAVYNIKNTPLH